MKLKKLLTKKTLKKKVKLNNQKIKKLKNEKKSQKELGSMQFQCKVI